MVKGIKGYYTYETMKLETAGAVYLNLSNRVKEYFVNIPVLTTRGSCNISINAVYSNQNVDSLAYVF